MQQKYLEREMRYFNTIRHEFLGRARGEYVLIKDDVLIGTWRSKIDAINSGYERFGNTPFLVKKILEFDETASFTSNLIALT